ARPCWISAPVRPAPMRGIRLWCKAPAAMHERHGRHVPSAPNIAPRSGQLEMAMYDLVIRGGTVVDGLGHDPISTDVAVKDGRIAKIGAIPADAAEVVDAGGLALMPGIIDLHTHYDAQVTGDPTLSPSPSLGVTTAVMGNCGFGIVPSPPLLRDMIMRNLAVVEGMDLD